MESRLGLQSEVRAEPRDGILDGKLESEINAELEPGTCVEKPILGDEPCSPVLSSQRSRREETDLTDVGYHSRIFNGHFCSSESSIPWVPIFCLIA